MTRVTDLVRFSRRDPDIPGKRSNIITDFETAYTLTGEPPENEGEVLQELVNVGAIVTETWVLVIVRRNISAPRGKKPACDTCRWTDSVDVCQFQKGGRPEDAGVCEDYRCRLYRMITSGLLGYPQWGYTDQFLEDRGRG